jgi:dGTP triphosphohydrolase
MEDSLKKLDKLTQEETRMATAEVMRSTHAIDQSVKEVRDGAQFIKFKPEKILNLSRLDGKEAKKLMKQAVNDVDQTKRPSSSNISLLRPTAFCTR